MGPKSITAFGHNDPTFGTMPQSANPQTSDIHAQTFSPMNLDQPKNHAMSTCEAGPSQQLPATLNTYHNATGGSAPDNFASQASSSRSVMSQTPGEEISEPYNTIDAFTPNAVPVISTAEDIKPLLLERLKDHPVSIYKNYIRGAADFDRQSRLYRSLSFKPAGFAEDFPLDDAELEVLAKGLTDAMMNMDGVAEAGKKSVSRIHQLSPYEIILKSWNLLFTLRDVQLGQADLHLWGAEWNSENFDCFHARYEDVRAKLHNSKSLVSSLFDQDFSIRLALNPTAEYKKKVANCKNNSRRAVALQEARDNDKRLLDRSEDEVAPLPKRRKEPDAEEVQDRDQNQEHDLPAYADENALLASGAFDITEADLQSFWA